MLSRSKNKFSLKKKRYWPNQEVKTPVSSTWFEELPIITISNSIALSVYDALNTMIRNSITFHFFLVSDPSPNFFKSFMIIAHAVVKELASKRSIGT
jgi:hypothetical protein